jgi:hypothetical protein
MVGLSRLERLTSPLSAGCSNQLSYRPSLLIIYKPMNSWNPCLSLTHLKISKNLEI